MQNDKIADTILHSQDHLLLLLPDHTFLALNKIKRVKTSFATMY